MENTGRIKETLRPQLQHLIYGKNSNISIDNELKYITKIDKAHILMLYKQSIIDLDQASRILNEIINLENVDYCMLRNKDTPRGIYFLYEDYLSQKIGVQNAGMLQFGRSRNDLKVTVLKLRLRNYILDFFSRSISFLETLIKKSEEYSDTIMPIYTHYQPAVPITYGHYLAAVSEELLSILDNFINNEELNKFSLGSGAAGGTTVSIDTNYTMKLLGFTTNIINSITGVASRKIILDYLSFFVEVESLISRVCEDFLLWTSSDFQFISLPDSLVGGSSMMPNKRNAFLFENIRGKCSISIGAYISAVNAMKGEPFTNSIAVGTEATAHIWHVFDNIQAILILFTELINNAIPNSSIMLNRCQSGYVLATEYANYLTLHFGVDFRSAHKIIGSLVTKSIETKETLENLLNKWLIDNYNDNSKVKLNVLSIVDKTNYGWGPGKKSRVKIIKSLRNKLDNFIKAKDILINRWANADQDLEYELTNILKGV